MNTYYRNIVFFIILTIGMIPDHGYGQQTPLYTQYMFNGLVINPAYAGSQESMSVTALHRRQWTGMNEGPSTQNIIAHAPLNKNKIAFGLIATNDFFAGHRQSELSGIYVYRIALSEKRKIAFGLQTGFAKFSGATNRNNLKDPVDPLFATDYYNSSSMYFGTGIYYSSENFYLGLSSPHLKRIDFNNSTYLSSSSNYFLNSGYIIKLSPHFKLIPSTLIKIYNLIPQIDLNTILNYEDVFYVGISYRTFNSLNFISKVQINDQLCIGYAYDNTTNRIKAFGKGGHEFVLTYNFLFFKSNILTPRDF